jgi:hypothetical protein
VAGVVERSVLASFSDSTVGPPSGRRGCRGRTGHSGGRPSCRSMTCRLRTHGTRGWPTCWAWCSRWWRRRPGSSASRYRCSGGFAPARTWSRWWSAS